MALDFRGGENRGEYILKSQDINSWSFSPLRLLLLLVTKVRDTNTN
ncbi:MAG: hypothetical protein Q8S84_03820 [bacterium]|nr:hypothetical protein [bacterium]